MNYKKSMLDLKEQLEEIYKVITDSEQLIIDIMKEANEDMGFFMQEGELDLAKQYMMLTANLALIANEKLPETWNILKNSVLMIEHMTKAPEIEDEHKKTP